MVVPVPLCFRVLNHLTYLKSLNFRKSTISTSHSFISVPQKRDTFLIIPHIKVFCFMNVTV